MKKILFTLLICCTGFVLSAQDFSYKDIPVQDGGRIKPLDTFARNQLLSVYGKRSLKSENLPAIEWLLDLLVDPNTGFNQKIFNIRRY